MKRKRMWVVNKRKRVLDELWASEVDHSVTFLEIKSGHFTVHYCVC